MIDKLQEVENRFLELEKLLSSPEVVADRKNFAAFSKERSNLQPIIECYRKWRKVKEEIDGHKLIVENSNDKELRELAQSEIPELYQTLEALNSELLILLLPKDPRDEKNTIIEIRAGTGGDEAALFCADLFNMFTRFAERKRWRVEIMSISDSSAGGYKEVIARIEGHGAFSYFKYEKGVHRVQRVPKTETQGRVHTSTVTVAVLPEADEVDVEVLDKDLRIDVFRSSGPGGQSVNTTDSAVRVTHLPTNLVVTCQDEKSQHKNKAKALTVLRSRLLEMKQDALDAERRDDRRTQIGSGERAEKIRTYNFPQGRVTDHRIGHTVYQLDKFLNGEMELMTDALNTHYQAEALKGAST